MFLESAYHPTDAHRDTSFMKNVNSYMLRQDVPCSGSQNKGVLANKPLYMFHWSVKELLKS